MAATIFQCFAPLSVLTIFQLTPTLSSIMTNHFCVFVLFDYSCDMDHECESKTNK